MKMELVEIENELKLKKKNFICHFE